MTLRSTTLRMASTFISAANCEQKPRAVSHPASTAARLSSTRTVRNDHVLGSGALGRCRKVSLAQVPFKLALRRHGIRPSQQKDHAGEENLDNVVRLVQTAVDLNEAVKRAHSRRVLADY